jgi:hypothetical protein
MAIVSFLAPSGGERNASVFEVKDRVRSVADPNERLRRHRYGGLVEALVDEPSFLLSTMFGFLTCYVHGRLVLALADKRPPWRGLLVPTDRTHHATLRTLVPDLRVHPVLGKWLYLPDASDDFEESARRLVALARADDPRIGVESAPRRRRAKRN